MQAIHTVLTPPAVAGCVAAGARMIHAGAAAMRGGDES